MRAVWFEGGAVEVRTLPDPQPRDGEAVVQVSLAGICATDLELLRGYAGFSGIPGHEFVGRVVKGPAQLLDQRVVADINVACGSCRECRQQNQHHCRQRAVLGIRDRAGAFAEYISVPAANLFPVPTDLTDRQAVFAEPLAAADAAVAEVASSSGPVLVIGAGKLGLLVVQCLLADGRAVVLARRQATPLPIPVHRRLDLLVADQLPERSFSTAIECSGNPEGARLALRSLRPQGTLVLKSTYIQPLQLDSAEIVVNELRLLGSRCGTMARALSRLAEGQVNTEALPSEILPLDEVVAALDRAAQPGLLKVLLNPN